MSGLPDAYNPKYDAYLTNLAQNQPGGITQILDTFFGFLRRKTDFFTGVSKEQSEQIVISKMREHRSIAEKEQANKKSQDSSNKDAEAEAKKKAEERKKVEEEARKKREALKKKAEQEAEKKKKAEQEAEKKKKAEQEAKKKLAQETQPSSKATSSSDNNSEEKKSTTTPPKFKKAGDMLIPNEDYQKLLPEPNNGNGGDGPGYVWTQSLEEIDIIIDLPKDTPGRNVAVILKKEYIKASLKSSGEILIEGKLSQPCQWDELTWTVVDRCKLQITFPKVNQMDWWDCVVIGHPEINTRQVNPESSKLSDLDGSTRAQVEKMMHDQHNKRLGLPTSEEQKKQDILKKFMSQHPEMDFSNAKIM